MSRACARCLRRSWLLARLGGHLENARSRIDQALALSDEELIAATAGRQRELIEEEFIQVDVEQLRGHSHAAGVELICRCDPQYPAGLWDLDSPPAVLHVAGGIERLLGLVAEDPVAIVGARRASPYGLEVARSLGRGLARAGLTVVSGMALGVDSAAHAGAIEAQSPTVAVMPGPAERPYPARGRRLHRKIVAGGAAVSELPCGAGVWRWTFPARNRIIAALAATAVVVEAGERSGALLTAGFARDLGRPVGAVPGRITSPTAAGSNALLADGAYIVRGPQDVLDQLFGAGVRAAGPDPRDELSPRHRRLLDAIGRGHDTTGALGRAGFPGPEGLADLASLELAGYIRRGAGGRWQVVP
jgi:DNA processing protein